jgi:hypothetical protein
MFCALKDLVTESDVEQKLLWPLLTTLFPTGLGLIPSDVLTKMSIRRLEVGKGTSRKLYFPDYMVVIAGLPVLVVEAKAPGSEGGPAPRCSACESDKGSPNRPNGRLCVIARLNFPAAGGEVISALMSIAGTDTP